jgi:hypothetical protein
MDAKKKDKSWKEVLKDKVHGRIRYRIRKQLERDGDKEVKQYKGTKDAS